MVLAMKARSGPLVGALANGPIWRLMLWGFGWLGWRSGAGGAFNITTEGPVHEPALHAAKDKLRVLIAYIRAVWGYVMAVAQQLPKKDLWVKFLDCVVARIIRPAPAKLLPYQLFAMG